MKVRGIIYVMLLSTLCMAGCNGTKAVTTVTNDKDKSETVKVQKPSDHKEKEEPTVPNVDDTKKEEPTVPNVDNTKQAEEKTKIEASNLDDHLRGEKEELLFGFDVAGSKKKLAVCYRGEDYIVYRFGTKDCVEFQYPEYVEDAWNSMTYDYYMRGGGVENLACDLNYLTFEHEDYTYQVYDEYDTESESSSIGILVTDKKTEKVTDIKGNIESKHGSLNNLRWNSLIKKAE